MTDRDLHRLAELVAARPEEEALADRLAPLLVSKLDARGFAILPIHRGRDPLVLLSAEIDQWRHHLRCTSKADLARGYVYAVQFRDAPSTPVKIGRTIDLDERLANLQRMSPFALSLVGLVHGAARETTLHYRFRLHRLHGEWFDGAAVAVWLRTMRGNRYCAGCR